MWAVWNKNKKYFYGDILNSILVLDEVRLVNKE